LHNLVRGGGLGALVDGLPLTIVATNNSVLRFVESSALLFVAGHEELVFGSGLVSVEEVLRGVTADLLNVGGGEGISVVDMEGLATVECDLLVLWAGDVGSHSG